MGRSAIIFVLFLTVLGSAVDAEARSGRQNQVPHGSQFGCDVCHTPAGGLNDFGFDSFDYTNGGTVDWSGLAPLDSDRDGYTNGQELGDPNGTWSPGDSNPSGAFSNPGLRDDGLCGNGSLEGEEECESGDLQGATCGSLGLGAGNLSCSDSCRFDTSGCDTCGDGTIQGGEECDGSDLAGNTCASLGLGSGTLSCTGCSYNTVGCSAPADQTTPDTCGDGMRQTGEVCDGTDLGGETCATLGFAGGTLGCQVRCVFDTSSCSGGSGVSTSPEPSSGQGGYSAYGEPASTPEAQDPNKIELEGYACSTTPSRATGAPAAAVLLLALTCVVRLRRRGAR